jgi:hypothetical protein
MTDRFRERPCHSCPYRQDVPSGIWDESEYEKLLLYDKPTAEQPPQVFACHDGDGKNDLCRGWWDCHSQNPEGHELLSIRFAAAFGRIEELPPPSDVPCLASGQEAYEHGTADIDELGGEAERRIEILTNKHPRIRRGNDAQED